MCCVSPGSRCRSWARFIGRLLNFGGGASPIFVKPIILSFREDITMSPIADLRDVRPLPVIAGRGTSFYERLVMRALEEMTLGGLVLTFPDGRCWVLGDPAAEISASLTVRRPDFFRKCVLQGDVGFGE